MTADSWDDFAADWDDEPDVRKYADKAFESWQRKAAPLILSMAETRVLDFGCGTGLLTEKLAPLCQHVVAVDTSVEMIGVLKRKIIEAGVKNVTPLVTSIDSKAITEYRDTLGQFGLVVASSVCSFLPDFEATLCHIVTAMKPGGMFVQWDWLDDMPAEKICDGYAKAGMICISVEKEFDLADKGGSMTVVMGIGKLDD
jgi:2-polyprenyl-3-methyl-5-hydroxy-6-metoxy-1,4-benzoquinol methylase